MMWMAAESAAEHQYQYIRNSMGVMQDWGDSQAGGLDTAGVMAGADSSALPSAAHSLLGHYPQPVQDPLQRGEPMMSTHLCVRACHCPQTYGWLDQR